MVEVLERGDIRFFYRPIVQAADEPVGGRAPGVQSFFLVLSPAGGASRGVHRRVRIGKKRMPSPSGERLWARVERVGSLDRVLADQLEDEHYRTKTRGERYQPGARALGEGCYAFVRHDDHTHFVYRIDRPEPELEVPDEVRPSDAGGHLVLFERESPGRALWTTSGAPARLDEEGAELVLVGIDDDPERELGISVLPPALPVA